MSYTYLDDNLKERTMTVGPNKILVRKCEYDASKYLVGEATGEADSLASLYLESLTSSTPINFCEVLDIGERRPWHKRQRKAYKVAKWFWPEVEVGDLVALPEMSSSGRMWRGVINDYDLIVDNHECKLIYKGSEDG